MDVAGRGKKVVFGVFIGAGVGGGNAVNGNLLKR